LTGRAGGTDKTITLSSVDKFEVFVVVVDWNPAPLVCWTLYEVNDDDDDDENMLVELVAMDTLCWCWPSHRVSTWTEFNPFSNQLERVE
jgi:hypothetical protein